MQHPLLNLGLLGFTAEQVAWLRVHLAFYMAKAEGHVDGDGSEELETSHPVWQVTPFREANAVLLNTERASVGQDGMLRFAQGFVANEVVGVRVSELSVPYAMCCVPTIEVEALVGSRAPRVALDDERSVVLALQHFEAVLRPMRTAYALAQELIDRREELDNKHTYHLVRNGVLDVIVDVPQRRVLVRDGVRPFDLDEAIWSPRPKSANSLPQGFSIWMMEEVAWIHALHSPSLHLPERYKQKLLFLRRLPRVRASMIYPRHTHLLEALGQEPATYAQLLVLWPQRAATLERDLYALFVCRAISTNADGAYQPEVQNAGRHLATDLPSKAGPQLTFQLETMHAPLK
jgi:hypothetical protein